jgi:hypothetical protein
MGINLEGTVQNKNMCKCDKGFNLLKTHIHLGTHIGKKFIVYI